MTKTVFPDEDEDFTDDSALDERTVAPGLEAFPATPSLVSASPRSAAPVPLCAASPALGYADALRNSLIFKANDHDCGEEPGLVQGPSDHVNPVSLLLDEGSIPSITLSEEEKGRIRRPWALAITFKVLGRTFSFNSLLEKLAAIWKIQGTLNLIDVGEGFYTIKCGNSEEFEKILHGGPWFLAGHFIATRKWQPNFDPRKTVMNISALWVRLPKLPLEYYDAAILRAIGNGIGKLLKMDVRTERAERGRYARLCVQVDLNKPLIHRVKVEDLYLELVYEGIQAICFDCGRVGHKMGSCPQRLQEVKAPGEGSVNQGCETLADDIDIDLEDRGFGPWMMVRHKNFGRKAIGRDNRNLPAGNGPPAKFVHAKSTVPPRPADNSRHLQKPPFVLLTKKPLLAISGNEAKLGPDPPAGQAFSFHQKGILREERPVGPNICPGQSSLSADFGLLPPTPITLSPSSKETLAPEGVSSPKDSAISLRPHGSLGKVPNPNNRRESPPVPNTPHSHPDGSPNQNTSYVSEVDRSLHHQGGEVEEGQPYRTRNAIKLQQQRLGKASGVSGSEQRSDLCSHTGGQSLKINGFPAENDAGAPHKRSSGGGKPTNARKPPAAPNLPKIPPGSKSTTEAHKGTTGFLPGTSITKEGLAGETSLGGVELDGCDPPGNTGEASELLDGNNLGNGRGKSETRDQAVAINGTGFAGKGPRLVQKGGGESHPHGKGTTAIKK